MQEDWCPLVLEYWRRHGLSDEQAQDCLSDLFLRYHRRTDLPAWGAGKPPPALWVMARDLLCEHWRQGAREKERLERMQAQCVCGCESDGAGEVEARLFALSLSPRLDAVLTLRLEGYTCREIAERLGLSEGTVKGYLGQLRQRFRDFFGYDPTKRPCSIGYIYGSLTAGEDCLEIAKEDDSDASTHRSDVDGDRAVGGKRVRPAAHPRRARRRAGGVDPASLTLGEGCGCGNYPPSSVNPLPTVDLSTAVPSGSKAPAASCIDMAEECGTAQVETQWKCNNESTWWCTFGPERYKRWKYDWTCAGGCHIVRCCPWTFVECCDTQTGDVPCQGNDPPCVKRPCSEPQINCN